MNNNHNGEYRMTALLSTLAIFGVLLWMSLQAGAYINDMSIFDFTVHEVGGFLITRPVTLTVPAAIIVAMVYFDILEEHFGRMSDAAAHLFKDRVVALSEDPDAQANEILAARQIN